MIKTKLEKESEEYFKSICGDYNEEYERTGKRHYWVGFDIKDAYLAGAKPRESELKNLKKENAELKEYNKYLKRKRQAAIQKQYNKVAIIKQQSEQLIKAKELLKWALHSDPEHDEDFEKKWNEAEQFLNSEVERNVR